MNNKKITILGIETSCDETAASILEVVNDKLKIVSNVVSSQVKIHAQYGGIVPEVAARHHAENIISVLEVALKELGIRNWELEIKKNIDAIAVTSGPGLITSLLIGVEAAKTLAFLTNKPLIPANHLIGHIYANWLLPIGISTKSKIQNLKQFFPAVCLVVSGGHTELVLMRNFENFKKIGQTLDDAAGECFDKVAKILGLGYPGGPSVAYEATKIKNNPPVGGEKIKNIGLPRPMINSKDFNFSFSGLKTAVLYKVQNLGFKIKNLKPQFCAEFQQAVIDVLINKTINAAKRFKVKSIILGGGVVANQELRKQTEEMVREKAPKTQLLIPELKYTTDNAAMIAVAGYFKLMKTPRSAWLKKFDWQRIKVDPNLEI